MLVSKSLQEGQRPHLHAKSFYVFVQNIRGDGVPKLLGGRYHAVAPGMLGRELTFCCGYLTLQRLWRNRWKPQCRCQKRRNVDLEKRMNDTNGQQARETVRYDIIQLFAKPAADSRALVCLSLSQSLGELKNTSITQITTHTWLQCTHGIARFMW